MQLCLFMCQELYFAITIECLTMSITLYHFIANTHFYKGHILLILKETKQKNISKISVQKMYFFTY